MNMKINSISLTIDNFDNDTMDDQREVSRILRELAKRVDAHGIVHAFDGSRLQDINGNSVGRCKCDWDFDEGDMNDDE
jgi:hypothetical protein